MAARTDKDDGVYDAVVVGAGPGGLAAVCALLDQGVGRVGWVDCSFGGGRLNGLYRDIPSNTKIHIYLDALETSSSCQEIIKRTPKPNAVTVLQDMDPESTCHLAKAGDMIMMLQHGLFATSKVVKIVGQVTRAEWSKDAWWQVAVGADGNNDQTISAQTLILATGSHPKTASFHEKYNDRLEVIDLDTALGPSALPRILQQSSLTRPPRVAIIGNSHSAILVVRKCYELAKSTIPGLKVTLFEQRPLVYAEYLPDGIVHDNTGLKGTTADWAKDVLDSEKASDVVERVHLAKGDAAAQEAVYSKYLPSQTHLVYAIGYARSPIPQIVFNGKRVDSDLVFDADTSGFKLPTSAGEHESVQGLFGCGIAFPEQVADPHGNVESAVGVAKFFKFAERVNKDWVKKH